MKNDSEWTDEQFENRLDENNVPMPRELLEEFASRDFGVNDLNGHYECEFCGSCLDSHNFWEKIILDMERRVVTMDIRKIVPLFD